MSWYWILLIFVVWVALVLVLGAAMHVGASDRKPED